MCKDPTDPQVNPSFAPMQPDAPLARWFGDPELQVVTRPSDANLLARASKSATRQHRL